MIIILIDHDEHHVVAPCSPCRKVEEEYCTLQQMLQEAVEARDLILQASRKKTGDWPPSKLTVRT